MPTERFNQVKPQVAYGTSVKLVSQAFGSNVSAIQLANAPGAGISKAGLFSTAPYNPSKKSTVKAASLVDPDEAAETPDPRYGKCPANDDTCNAWATKKWAPHCNAHGRALQGLSSWAPVGGDE